MTSKKLRSVSILLIVISPAVSLAQGKIPKKILPKIGVSQTASYPDFDADAKGFEKALAEAGFKEGTHITYDRQNARGDVNRTQTIAERFMNSDVALIHSIGTPSSRAVMKIIKDVPIVFSSVTEPVYAGLIPRKRPLGTKTGTNVTGVSDRWPVPLQLEMYAQFIPKAKKWGTIYNAGDPRTLIYIKEMRQAAKKLNMELIEVNISQDTETLPAAQFLVGKVQTIYITYDHIALSSFESIVKVCNQMKIPLFGGDLKCVTLGAIAAYGWDYFQIGHSAGKKAVRILKGEKPGDIPWDSGEKLILLINEKAARAQGAIISPELLKRADRLVQ
ncbi:MAG TPA: ABC transporter substrate-binding protein [Thermodesulfobacteriota bacterium]|nr:ABC transporter substrate-binding protein [Thermodesulfobacteriota bacterium]